MRTVSRGQYVTTNDYIMLIKGVLYYTYVYYFYKKSTGAHFTQKILPTFGKRQLSYLSSEEIYFFPKSHHKNIMRCKKYIPMVISIFFKLMNSSSSGHFHCHRGHCFHTNVQMLSQLMSPFISYLIHKKIEKTLIWYILNNATKSNIGFFPKKFGKNAFSEFSE